MKNYIKTAFVIMITFLIVSECFSSVAIAQGFSDLQSTHWANGSINTLISKGILKGYPDNSFRPNATLTQGEFLKMLNMATGYEVPTTNAGGWAISQYDKANELGYLAGVEEPSVNTSTMGTMINRALVAKMISNAMYVSMGAIIAMPDKELLKAYANDMTDNSNYYDAVLEMMQIGIISGYNELGNGGSFYPTHSLTRAEGAAVIERLMDPLKRDCIIDANNNLKSAVTTTVEPVVISSETLGDYRYNVYSDNTAAIAKYLGDDTAIVLPDKLGGHRVTKIERNAFVYHAVLTSVKVPNTVTTIDDMAFYQCQSLANVQIPASVTEIGGNSFTGTKWLDTQTDEFVIVGDHILLDYNGSKANVSIPNGIKNICNAFENNKLLTSVQIPQSVTKIGDLAFAVCTSLTSVEIPASVTEIGSLAFTNCTSLTNVQIMGNLTKIGENAFDNCTSLVNVQIPDSLIEIGNCAFAGCTSLVNVQIPDGVMKIGELAFSNCTSLVNVQIPGSVTRIGNGTFGDCSSLRNAQISNGVTEIDADAFSDCDSLINVQIPGSVTKIGSSAFARCDSLQTVYIANGVSELGPSAFHDCDSLISVWIPGSVKRFEDNVFSKCKSLRNIQILDGVTEIGISAFYDCDSLINVQIPGSVIRIGTSAFSGCNSLKLALASGSYAEQWAKDNNVKYVVK